MSRIGKLPINIPNGVSVDINGLIITVKGPKGELKRIMPEGVNFDQKENQIVVTPATTKRYSRERHGLCRTLLSNMVQGVTEGYSKKFGLVHIDFDTQERTPKQSFWTYKNFCNLHTCANQANKNSILNEHNKFHLLFFDLIVFLVLIDKVQIDDNRQHN